ncbi:MAG: (d)CMP kinase [bacterium]
MSGPVIAIDGPSGSGTSSTARGVAERLGLRYVDTGAMYRAMTWWMLRNGVDPGDAASVAALCERPAIELGADPGAPGVRVDGADVSADIRGSDVGAAVSIVSAVPEVRRRLVALQRSLVAEALGAGGGVVVEGRDIGTVVLPDADLKVFLVADAQARARRRAQEDAERAGRADYVDAEAVTLTEEHLRSRDALDTGRAVSPLRPADDAVLIDGTDLTLDEVIAAVISALDARSDQTDVAGDGG